MSNEMCTPLKLKKKLLLAIDLLGQGSLSSLSLDSQKPRLKEFGIEGGSLRVVTAVPQRHLPQPAFPLSPSSENPWIVELQKEIHSNQNEKLSVANKSTSK